MLLTLAGVRVFMGVFWLSNLLWRLPGREQTPVIMLTAKGQDTDRARAAELGAPDFLTKPFSPKKLLARIDELFTS